MSKYDRLLDEGVLDEGNATTPPKVPSGGNKADNPHDGDPTGIRDGTPTEGRFPSSSTSESGADMVSEENSERDGSAVHAEDIGETPVPDTSTAWKRQARKKKLNTKFIDALESAKDLAEPEKETVVEVLEPRLDRTKVDREWMARRIRGKR